jgi:hypothetical protein
MSKRPKITVDLTRFTKEQWKKIGESFAALGAGTATVIVSYLERNSIGYRHTTDPDFKPFIHLEMIWEGDDWQPERWEIERCRFGDYLKTELAGYLKKVCPCPDEMWATMLAALSPEVRSCFESEDDPE